MARGLAQQELQWLGLDFDGLLPHLERYRARFADLIERSEGRWNAEVKGLTWSVGEVVTHVVATARIYLEYFEGRADIGYDVEDIPASNERFMASHGAPDARTSLKDFTGAMSQILHRAKSLGPGDRVPWHVGPVPPGVILGVLLNELLLHGRDLAQGLGVDWGIDEEAASHGVRAACAAAPFVVDRELAARCSITYRVRVAGLPPGDWSFTADGLAVRPVSKIRPDCSIAIKPSAFLLLAYGRTSPLSASLRGKALSWGRRPLAAFRLTKYLIVG